MSSRDVLSRNILFQLRKFEEARKTKITVEDFVHYFNIEHVKRREALDVL
jgi:hypothetical protein